MDVSTRQVHWVFMILPKLMAWATGAPRYLPEIEWSDRLITHNIFRLYELVFWRRHGIRAEATSYYWRDKSGNHAAHFFHSWEAFIAYGEVQLRSLFKLPEIGKIRVWVPVINTPQGIPIPASPFLLAVAVDSTSTALWQSASSSPVTMAFTNSGGNLLTVGICRRDEGDVVNSVTYNGDSLTQIAKLQISGTSNWSYMYYKASPATGANNISVGYSVTGSDIFTAAASYSGCDTTTPINDHGTNTGSGTNASATTTPSVSGCWAVCWASIDGGVLSAGTNSTLRGALNTTGDIGREGWFDSNGTITSGAGYTMHVTSTVSAPWTCIVASIAVATNTNYILSTISESLATSDVAALAAAYHNSSQETITPADSVLVLKLTLLSIVETLTPSDAASESVQYAIVLADQATLSDLIAENAGYTVSIVDQVSPSDTVNILSLIEIMVQEVMTLGEVVLTRIPGFSFKSKHAASFTFRSKNNTSWTFRDKNSSFN